MTTISITYCVPCGYLKYATQLANDLKEKLNIDAELIPGKGGIFQVALNGTVIAKRTLGHFPTTAEEIMPFIK